MTRLEKQMAFLEEVDKIKLIGRQNYLADGSRKENDAEHSWHLALMTLLLSEYANEEIDVLKTMSMVLIHDIVEIDAGDTYAYDYEGQKTQHEREEAAADRIFNILPEDQANKLRALWDEFESGETPEARFAAAVDRVQPAMLNSSSGGISWREHGVTYSNIVRRNGKTQLGSQALWDYAKEHFIDANVENGLLIDDRRKEEK
ncbi:MAG: HD domain-containing protein [Clostridiales bacterium]|nr:HD domain-containing protein [Clostridiales bacterium]